MINLDKHHKAILTLIDRGQWKHSWHLHKNSWGTVDWSNKENQKRIDKIIQQRKEELKTLQKQIELADTALDVLHDLYAENDDG